MKKEAALCAKLISTLNSGEKEIATVGFAKATMTASVTVKSTLVVTA